MSVSVLVSNVTVTGSSLITRANFTGIGGTEVFRSGDYILVSGGGGGIWGALEQTGQRAINYTNIVGQLISGNLTQSGIFLMDQNNSLSGYLIGLINAATAGVSSINGASGVLTLQGTGSATVFQDGQIIYVSGNVDPTFYATISYVTGISGVINNRLTQSGIDLMSYASTYANDIGSILSGRLAESGALYNSINLSTSGALTGRIYDTGLGLYNQLYNTGQLLFNRDASISGGLEARIAQTGTAAITYSTIIGSILSGRLAESGALNIALNLSTSGALTGRIYQTGLNLYNQLYNSGQTLISYVIASSGGLEARLFQTGNAAVIHANGIGSILSGKLTDTGIALINRTNTISGVINDSVVHRYGDEQITGVKRFASNVIIQSGAYLGFGFPASGNSSENTDSIFFWRENVTADQTQLKLIIGDDGAATDRFIIGYQYFGNSGFSGVYSFPMNGAATINNSPILTTGHSGALDARIIATGNAAVAHANTIGTILSGKLTDTGVLLTNVVNGLSGVVNALYARDIVYRTGNQTISGYKNFLHGLLINTTGVINPFVLSGIRYASSQTGGLSIVGLNNQQTRWEAYYEMRSNAGGVPRGALGWKNRDADSLVSNSFEQITLADNGFVGVGAIAPSTHFHVTGNIRTDLGYYSGSTNIASIFATKAELNSASGWTDNFFVHRNGNEAITGNKNFIESIGFQVASPRALIDFGAAVTDKIFLYGINGSNNEYGFGIAGGTLKYFAHNSSNTAHAFGHGTGDLFTATNNLYVHGGASFGANTRSAFVHSTGAIRSDAGFFSGATNIASLFATTSQLTQTGVLLRSEIATVSGIINDGVVHRYGTEEITGNKNFVDKLGVGILNATEKFTVSGGGIYQASVGTSNLTLVELGNGAAAQIFLRNPTRAWDLGGDSVPDGFYIHEEGGSQDTFFIAGPSKFIGMGTNTPAASLHVTGNVRGDAGQYYPGNLITSDYTVRSVDNFLYCNNTNPITLTLGSSVTNSGQMIKIKLINTGIVYLTGTAGQTFDGSALYVAVGQYNTYEAHAFNSNWYIW
jgi:hypothetical protein